MLDLERMIASGAMVWVGTVDDAGRTAVTRGWGLSVIADDRVELCITAADESEVRWNLDSTGRVAVSVTKPQNYSSVQLKGITSAVRAFGPDDRARVDAHLEKVVEATKFVGMEGTEALMLGELRVIEIHVASRFDQTPGPNAGRRIS